MRNPPRGTTGKNAESFIVSEFSNLLSSLHCSEVIVRWDTLNEDEPLKNEGTSFSNICSLLRRMLESTFLNCVTVLTLKLIGGFKVRKY
jgi:hypothetical protein